MNVPNGADFRQENPSWQSGLRKIRWKGSGRGKRGGIRVIYYLVTCDQIYLLYAYPKNKQENLTQDQIQRLRKLVEQYLDHEHH